MRQRPANGVLRACAACVAAAATLSWACSSTESSSQRGGKRIISPAELVDPVAAAAGRREREVALDLARAEAESEEAAVAAMEALALAAQAELEAELAEPPPPRAPPQPEAAPGVGLGESPAAALRRLGQRDWIVDGYVGQVNGRPIFANEFFDPIEDRIRQLAASPNRAQSRLAIVGLVSQRFDELVNNELVIAEAESLLTPEQKAGFFAWLQDIQEREVLARGGTAASAESSIQEEFGLTMDEFMASTRNAALARTLLDRRVKPRTIVSWRDVELEYRRRQSEFQPGATLRVGRIWLQGERDAERIATARRLFQEGRSFAEVAGEIGVENDGLWEEFAIGEGGLDAIEDLSDSFKERLRGLEPGQASEEFAVGRFVVWLGNLGVNEPPATNLFDPDLQLALRQELEAFRQDQERDRYIRSLRRRWVAANIDAMRTRLAEIALDRYWR